MNWYNIFYWISRGDSIKDFFDTSSNIFTTLTVFAFIGVVVLTILLGAAIDERKSSTPEEDKRNPTIRSFSIVKRNFTIMFYVLLGFSLLTWAGYVLTPTKKEGLLILAGGGAMQFLTTDSAAKELPHEMTNFVVSELKTMAQEAKVDFGIASQKDKILEEAKTMTATQLVERMKIDTNFAKVILNN